MNKVDQEFAEAREPELLMTARYTQIIAGWSGGGFDSSFRMVEGGFIHASNVARIQFEIIDTVGKRRISRSGGIALTEAEAVKFALAIAPDYVATAYNAHAQLVTALTAAQQQLTLIESQNHPFEQYDQLMAIIDAALTAAGAK